MVRVSCKPLLRFQLIKKLCTNQLNTFKRSVKYTCGNFDFLRKFNELGSMLDARTSRLDPLPDSNVVFSFNV